MDVLLSFNKKRLKLQLVISLTFLVMMTYGEVTGYFQCTKLTVRKAIICSSNDLPEVRDGAFDCFSNSSVSEGDACTLTCNDGFYSAFSNQVVCESGVFNQTGGVWSDGNFVCHAITCSTNDLPKVKDGSFDCVPNSNVSKGGACQLTCSDGFYPAFSNQSVCEAGTSGGEWSDENFECHAITCQKVDLPTVSAGVFNCSGYSVGDKCNLTCDDGYYPFSQKETVCDENSFFKGNWTKGNFQCSAITCKREDLPTVKAGYFNCSGYSVGDKCNLTCNDGYYPSPKQEAVCEENGYFEGNWTEKNVQCFAITCSTNDLPKVTNGSFDCIPNSNVSKGDACNLSCDGGFYPAFSNKSECEAEAGDQEGKWSEGNFTCLAITCQKDDLPNVMAGIFDCSGDSVGEMCTLTCDYDYYPSSSRETICEENDHFQGIWTEGIFQCSMCNEWQKWGSEKEYQYNSNYMAFDDYGQFCENNGGHHVTIDTVEENDHIQIMAFNCHHMHEHTWIGLSRLDGQSTWEWSNNATVSYVNWFEGEPSTGDTCVGISKYTGKWYGFPCAGLQGPAVCERLTLSTETL